MKFLLSRVLVAAPLLLALAGAENICTPEFWKDAINANCIRNDSQVAQKLVLDASVCAFSPEFHQELRVYTPYPYLNETLRLRENPGSATDIEVVFGSSDDSLSASEEFNRDPLSYYDGFVVEAEFLADFAQLGVVAPLDQSIVSEPELSWYRISRYYRGFASLFKTRAYGVPLGGSGVFTFYRQDLFEQFNLTVPTTWEGLLETALAWSNAPRVPDVLPFCTSHRSRCAQTLLLSIAAPYMQTQGPREGFLIDATDGRLLLNTSGFTAALAMWQRLRGLSAADANSSCTGGHDAFSEGGCLMTVQTFDKFKIYASNSSYVSDKLGVALPPGAAVVMDHTTGSLAPCTQATCPYAASAPQPGSSAALVNVAPLMWGGLVGMVSARNPSGLQRELVGYLADLASNRSLENVLRRGLRISPFRSDHWSAASKRNWTDAGYAAAAVDAMLAALRALHACPNLAPALRLPGQEEVRHALAGALADLAAGREPGNVAAALQANTERILLARYGIVNGTAGYLELYRQQLGYTKSSVSVEAAAAHHSASGGVSGQKVAVIAVVIGLVLLLTSVVVLEVRNKRRHKDLLGRVKPPLGDPDTTIVVASIQDFDELWEALISDASERALQQFSDLVDALLRRHSGYRAPSEEEEHVLAAFHCPRDACEFARELQRGLLELRWPRHVLEMEQFRPQYLAQTKRATSFSQSYNGARAAMSSPLSGSMPAQAPQPAEDDDKLFSLDTGTDNVRSFGEQCIASWGPADASSPDAELQLVFCGIRARVGVCAVGLSRLGLDVGPGTKRFSFMGEAVEVAAAAAAVAQGGMVLIPQSTFRQLHLELLAEQCLFCHLGEYQMTSELPPMDLYLALDRRLLGRLAMFGPLACHLQWSQGAFAAPVHSASMVFTHVVGVQTLLAWDYELMQDVIETFTRLAQVELQQAGGYLVEHVEGFMLTAFHSPAEAILWGLRMQELMLKEDWPEELLAHELCEEVTVTVPFRGGEVTSATVFRGPRLKTGIDIGQVLARLHTMTGRMTYRGKVMNRAARISAAASSGQVLCSAEAWESCAASASALRLVTATSLGLFQLKGIQERIEVFHCTYQRHVPSSTRRSSTVSVGAVSSSDNRRKSAVVLSSLSRISHRTSRHNSAALENASASDIAAAGGGRGGSQASSSALLPGRGSLGGGGQLSDAQLHTAGVDAAGNGSATRDRTVAAAAPLTPLSVLGGCDGSGGAGGAVGYGGVSQTGNSQRSQGSGASGGGAPGGGGAECASHAARVAVLQSRTRSASAIHASSSVAPFRSASARTRRPVGFSGGAATSEPQVSLIRGAHMPGSKWSAGTATSPSANPSLAMAAAAAAVAAQERAYCNSVSSPKTAAALDLDLGLDLPRGASRSGGNAVDSAPTHSTTYMGRWGLSCGANAEPSAAMVTAAVYAVLPSVVLSGGLAVTPSGGSSPPPTLATPTSYGSGCGGGSSAPPPYGPSAPSKVHDAREVGSGSGGNAITAAVASARAPFSSDTLICAVFPEIVADASPNGLQVATIATCVEDIVVEGRRDSGGAAPANAAAHGGDSSAGAGGSLGAGLHVAPCQPPLSSDLHFAAAAAQRRRHLQQPFYPPHLQPAPLPPPFRLEGVVALGPLHEDSPQAEGLCIDGGSGILAAAAAADGDDGSFDDGSRVETLEVTMSATGIARGVLSGAASSTGFGAALGSSQGMGGSISRCGSATVGISYLALGLNNGLGSSPGGGGGVTGSGGGGGGSHASSCTSGGFGHVGYTHAHAAAVRSASAAVRRASLSASPQQVGLHGVSSSPAVGRPARFSGSASIADLFLPFPLGGGGGGASTVSGGGTTLFTSSGVMLVGLGAGLPSGTDARISNGGGAGAALDASNQEQRFAAEGAIPGVTGATAAATVGTGAATVTTPAAVPKRVLAAVQGVRLAEAAAGVAEGSAAPVARAASSTTSSSEAVPGFPRPSHARLQATTAAGPAPPMAPEATADAVLATAARLSLGGAAARQPPDGTAAVAAAPRATELRVHAVACDPAGSGDVSASLAGSDSRSGNVCATAVAAADASAVGVPAPSRDSASRGRMRLTGSRGSGSGRLHANTRTGSGVSCDPASQLVSPASTLETGISAFASAGSSSTTTINAAAAPGSDLTSTGLISGASGGISAGGRDGLEQPLHQKHPPPPPHPKQQQHQVQHPSSVDGGREPDAPPPGGAAAGSPPHQERDKRQGKENGSGEERRWNCSGAPPDGAKSGTESRFSGSELPGGVDYVAGRVSEGDVDRTAAAAAMAAVFGFDAPQCNEYDAGAAVAAATAAFGFGPPPRDHGSGSGSGSGGIGPTRGQLALALALLGESHASGSGWH